MPSRLNELCKGFDRTAEMGLFPHDETAPSLTTAGAEELIGIADRGDDPTARDQAMWELVYRETAEARLAQLPDLLYSVATSAKEPVLRRSSSWGLLKLGETDLLAQCLRADDDGNTHSWKQTLIYESQGRTDWVDPRPMRMVESELGYATTLPLTIHGMVQFREYRYGDAEQPDATAAAPKRAKGQDQTSGASPAYAAYPPLSAYPSAARYGTTPGARPSSVRADPRAYEWHSLTAGPIAQRRMVGALTAAVGQGSFYDNLIIQKVCTDPMGMGFDHVQGYLFEGMSRHLGGNAMAHYYSSSGPQPLYLSGRIGDASEGVVEVETQLSRHAETHIVTNSAIPYPFVQSVRGLFFGPARMNTAIVRDKDAAIDNTLQIVKEPYANGWFFGEFRSVLVDVDGDGQVEVNGMEMYTDLAGQVLDRTPEGPQPSLAFAR